ncbi:hypothetical protein LJK88_49200 [Paenibacillus sp. P26]|nr:hypothetical protein LJK88_49200 [Paenibacillus sp. P26]
MSELPFSISSAASCEPAALDDPLRADADITAEQTLQGPFVHAEAGDDVLDLRHVPVIRDVPDDLSDQFQVPVHLRGPLAQELLRQPHHLLFTTHGEHLPLPLRPTFPENRGKAQDLTAQPGDGPLPERVESAGAEFDAEHRTLALQVTGIGLLRNAVDAGEGPAVFPLERYIDVGVRQDRLPVGEPVPANPTGPSSNAR